MINSILFSYYYRLYIPEMMVFCIADMLTKGECELHENHVKLLIDTELNYIEGIMRSIKLGKSNNITRYDIENMKQEISRYLVNNEYIIKIPLFGFIKTLKYRKYIIENKSKLNSNLKRYLFIQDYKYLKNINKRLSEIIFSINDEELFKSFYKDMNDIMQNYFRIKYRLGAREYDKYYTNKNREKKIT